MNTVVRVSVRFFDDETVEGEARQLDFDQPDFLIDIDDLGGLENNEMAWVPLSAVKWVQLPAAAEVAEGATRKVAIRFLDGEVLRGHLDGQLARHRYGLILNLHPEVADEEAEVRRLGIPFSAIKAVFYVREFDGREPDQAAGASESYLARRTMAPLLDVLEEMDMLQRLHDTGMLDDTEYSDKRTHLLERL
ncbi:MAG: hypothetical protein EPN50_07585 [Chloroflexota bacterium]|nr:MAG: hypothetical protein EPN50_07585 [Chloroflexota bacterium]